MATNSRQEAEAARIEGDNLLEPTGSQRVVAEAEFVGPAGFLQAQFQRLNEAHQQSAVKELEICKNPLPTDVGLHDAPEFIEVECLAG